MTTEEIINLDFRIIENRNKIQKILRKIKPFSKIDINEEVPIELLEKFIQKAFKRYNLRANFINIDFEQTNTYRVSFFTENDKLYYNIYGCCIYELYSKICIKIYSEVKNNKLIEYI